MAAAAKAAAAAALRSFGSRMKAVKEALNNAREKIDERTRSIILETFTRSAVMTAWGAGVLAVNNTLERLGLIETGLTNTVHMKEHTAAVAKAENEKALQQLKNKHEEDSAKIKKLHKEFEAHRALTKMWVSHMIEKTVEPLSRQDISRIQGAFALFDKAGDGFITKEEAKTVLEMFGDKTSQTELNKLLAQSGKIFIADFLEFIADKNAKAMEVQRSQLKAKQDEEVPAEGSSSP